MRPIKRITRSLTRIALATTLSAIPSFGGQVAETDLEFAVTLADGERFVIVDKATGQVRRGSLDGEGGISFEMPVRSGVEGVFDVSSGLLGPDGEALGLLGPVSNEIRFIEWVESGTRLHRFTTVLPQPAALSQIQAPNKERELLVLTDLGTMVSHFSITSSPLGKPQLEEDSKFARSLTPRALCLDFTNSVRPRLPIVLRDEGGARTLVMLRRDEEGIKEIDGPEVATSVEMTVNIGTTDGRHGILVYELGGVKFAYLPVNDAATESAEFGELDPTDDSDIAIGQVLPIDLDGTPGLMVISPDGLQANNYTIDGGNGLNLVQSFTPEAGERFASALGLPGGKMALLIGKAGNGPITSARSFVWTGSSWKEIESVELPKLLAAQSQFSTLFFYEGHPFLDPTSKLIELRPQEDWTRKDDDGESLPADVISANFVSGTGISNEMNVPVVPPSGADYLLVNQYLPRVSMAARKSDLALLQPSLQITPEAGGQMTTFLARGIFDQDRYRLLYKESSASSWTEYDGPIPVTYSSTWEFFLENIETGERGAVQSRTWTVEAAGLIRGDLDEDGVPDFVERELGLNPLGGADSDGDGASDLAELLAGTDPSNPASKPADADPDDFRDGIFTGDGFRLLARGVDSFGANMARGEAIELYNILAESLDRAQVEQITAHPNLGNLDAAKLFVENAQPAQRLIALETGIFFDSTVGSRGREIIRFLPQPVHETPAINPPLVGDNSAADTAAWITAAQAAYSGYDPVTELDEVRPEHSAQSVALELAIFDALVAEDLVTRELDEFSIMPWRARDAARTGFSREELDALVSQGFSPVKLMQDLQSEFGSPSGNISSLITLTDKLYDRHVSGFAADPSIPLPIDALRELATTGSLPAPVNDVVSAATINLAAQAFDDLRGLASTAYRPTATWTVEIPASSSGPGIYQRNDAQPIQFLDRNGQPFPLEQEMALEAGTVFSVLGYTDVASANGLPSMEPIQVVSVAVSTASENDQDGNLLDDEWERFYFGATGVDPQATNGLSEHTYLQHFLGGTDPRSEIPTDSVADLSAPQATISRNASGEILLSFAFPSEYQSLIDFSVSSSDDLLDFSTELTPVSVGVLGDTVTLNLGNRPALNIVEFYLVKMALK